MSPDLRFTAHFSDTIHLAVNALSPALKHREVRAREEPDHGRNHPTLHRFLGRLRPQYVKVKRLENDLSVAKQENALAQLRNLAALAFVQASQKNYGLAAGTSKQFFIRTREAANQAADANGRKALEDLLTTQEKITAELAKADPEALGDLQVLFKKTHQNSGSTER